MDMKLYRVENLITNIGLWYNSKDQKSSNVVHDLDLTNKTLPMDFNQFISKDHWKSAAGTIEQLRYWFSHEDLAKLIPLGFDLYEIDSDIVKEHTTPWYTHPLFQEIGVRDRKKLDINILLN